MHRHFHFHLDGHPDGGHNGERPHGPERHRHGGRGRYLRAEHANATAEVADELLQARRALKRALMARRDSSPQEQRHIAGILNRAAAEIAASPAASPPAPPPASPPPSPGVA